MLTILELTDKRIGHHPIYKCKCDCGNIVEISAHDLERDRIYSCGCTKMSKGEQKCWQLL